MLKLKTGDVFSTGGDLELALTEKGAYVYVPSTKVYTAYAWGQIDTILL